MKKLWLIISVLVVVVGTLLAYVIWDSAKKEIITLPAEHSTDANTTSSVPATPSDTSSATIPGEAPASYPAPARKLHATLTAPENDVELSPELNQRIEALNKELEAINKQLVDSGVAPIETDTVTDNNADMSERLERIREHLNRQP